MYQHTYQNMTLDYNEVDTSKEWLWNNLMYFSVLVGFDVSVFFFFVAAVYFGCIYYVCQRLFPNNVLIACLFFLVSFSCYSYSVNGIRNGMGCHMLLVAITIAATSKNKAQLAIAAFITFLAAGVHRSILLPAAATVTSMYVVKDPKRAIQFWVLSIFISLVSGNAVGELFAGLGFDDRMSGYFEDQNDEETMSLFSAGGFRFDFLLYSAMPVVMTWYMTVKRNFRDRAFNIIANTYILTNAFWVMVIRAAYSNRFAYLSWFIYPLVIVYPILRFRAWESQDQNSASIILAYAGFTYFMFFFYYGWTQF